MHVLHYAMLFAANIAVEQEIIVAVIMIAIFIFARFAWHTNMRSTDTE